MHLVISAINRRVLRESKCARSARMKREREGGRERERKREKEREKERDVLLTIKK